jgi:hypothetical protein
VERFSPGGWEDSDPPSGKGVSLLVGTADSFERFGIERPAYRDSSLVRLLE